MSNPEINWSEPHAPLDFSAPKCNEPWQPIETAPANTPIFVIGPTGSLAAAKRMVRYGKVGWVYSENPQPNTIFPQQLPFEPTHWCRPPALYVEGTR